LKPEVLAWALLFVVTFAVVYRFFAWVSRRFRARPSQKPDEARDRVIAEPTSASVAANDAPIAATPLAPVKFAEPRLDVPAPVAPLAITPAPVVGPVPKPAPARDYATAVPAHAGGTTAEGVALENNLAAEDRTAASSVAASLLSLPPRVNFVVPPSLGPSSAVISARVAGEAVRASQTPNVAATVVPLKPSVEATLPPASVASSLAPISANEAASPNAIIGPSAEPVRAAETEAPQETMTAITEPPFLPNEFPSKTVRLRARRIGADAARLDIRLRDSRERRTRRTPETARKTAQPVVVGRLLRVLGRKASPAKMPKRRIGQKDGGPLPLLSTRKTAMKVGGASRLRVLTAIGILS
jgi:hypothetical protein